MMRKTLLAAAMALSLASCSTVQVQQAEQFLAQVQAYTAQVCKFIPDIATIVGVWNATAGATVAGVGGAICSVIPPVASARYRALPKVGFGLSQATGGVVGGIQVHGWRTQ